MDGSAFDRVTRGVVSGTRRRGFLAGIGGGALAAVSAAVASSALTTGEAEAKKKKKKRKKKAKCRASNADCVNHSDCCSNRCSVGQDGRAIPVCCTSSLQPCSSDADCCLGLVCSIVGLCDSE